MKKLRPRKKESHKGDYGRVFVIAGSKGMTGAAYLTSRAALRAGAGLVSLAVPEAVYPILARRHAEVMVQGYPSNGKGAFSYASTKPLLAFARNQDVIAIGPGLSEAIDTKKMIRKIVAESIQSLVIDADGLNAFQGHLSDFKECSHRAILTPHPKEFMRLFGSLRYPEAIHKMGGRKISEMLRSDPNDGRVRKKLTTFIAKKYNMVILLKGHQTVVANPSGQVYVNQTGNPGMATAGSGDVLTGMIAAFVAQKLSLFDAACLGAYIHGLAGDLAAKKIGEVSLVAGDILEYLPQAIRRATSL